MAGWMCGRGWVDGVQACIVLSLAMWGVIDGVSLVMWDVIGHVWCHLWVLLTMWGVICGCHWPRVSHYSGDNTVSLGWCRQLLRDCHEIVTTSCDLVHARCTKVLGVRIKVIRLSHTLLQACLTFVWCLSRLVWWMTSHRLIL